MTSISEDEIRVFVEAVNNYFVTISQKNAEISAAYLGLGETVPPTFDYTGLITVGGNYRGCVYFSAPGNMIARLLLMLREPEITSENLLDAVGEIANTIVGNARRYFGKTMEISVPITMTGISEGLRSATLSRPYIIMIRWLNFDASVIIDIERKEPASAD